MARDIEQNPIEIDQSDPETTAMTAQPETPIYNPEAPHHQKPKLRPIQVMPMQNGEQQVIAVTDIQRLADPLLMMPQVQLVFQHMNGEKTLDEITEAVGKGLTREMLEILVAQLDQGFLLEGPTFDGLVQGMREKFDNSDTLPPSVTAMFADMVVDAKHKQEHGAESAASDEEKSEQGPAVMRELFDKWIDEALKNATDPSLDALPRAIFAPHIDYGRGWPNYAHVYGRLRVCDRPDRIIILGTNHHGSGTGVVACDKGYESPFGTCAFDNDFCDLLKKHMGDDGAVSSLFEHRFDHEHEHSIELHVPWIQHVFGEDDAGAYPKVFAALVHDPSHSNGESYDGNGIGMDPFVDALKAALDEAPGRTLIISSADLSHIGPMFGDKLQLTEETPEVAQFRDRVVKHDQQMLSAVQRGAADELITQIAWQQNFSRWCSIGNIVATLRATGGGEVRILNYGMAMDPNGAQAVSSFAAVLV